jgi:ATP/maltotriose-dependent transcriptional regulator MalT
MFKTALLVAAAALAATPSRAHACFNEVARTVEDDVRLVQRAEKLLEGGLYAKAGRTLKGWKFSNARLRERTADVRAVVALRLRTSKDDITWVVDHFKARTEAKAGAKDVRFRAMLAEAYFATGKLDEARTILTDLVQRDLMPDEYAYVTLAKMSSGTERYELWKTCRTKAKNKDVCELPKETISAKRAAS